MSLSPDQQEAWFAWMRVTLRLTYEMNHQLQDAGDVSLSDYHVLNALADAPSGRLQVTALAARISWERSRLSHQVRRMESRGLLRRETSTEDGRVTEAVLTPAGSAALLDATPVHAELVRRLFFDGLDPERV